jgi:hypothetical protein
MVNYEDARKESRSSDTPGKLRSEQLASLSGYKKGQIPDEASATPGAMKEVFMIPIEEAKKLVIQEFSKK